MKCNFLELPPLSSEQPAPSKAEKSKTKSNNNSEKINSESNSDSDDDIYIYNTPKMNEDIHFNDGERDSAETSISPNLPQSNLPELELNETPDNLPSEPLPSDSSSESTEDTDIETTPCLRRTTRQRVKTKIFTYDELGKSPTITNAS